MLSKIRIRNFRSISDLSIDLRDLNILIGKNDTGKSNILRALNLFFNDQTDFRTDYNFSRDFSLSAKTGQGKAPEIRIDLQFSIPNNYQVPDGAKAIEWTRRWRSDDVISQDPVFVLKSNKKEDISGRSKLWSYLNNIDYHYIPALKGKEYFSELLSDIYDVLSDVAFDDLFKASQPLQEEVERTLVEVAEELKVVLQNASKPKLPENLRSIFRLIQFESEGIDLDRRGDGIRVRHVPTLMKFLCDLKTRRAGHYQSGHIWGFEEPENSVDFISAFDLRDQILDISKKKEYQILMSTHSPVFFKLEEDHVANAMFFQKVDGQTCLSGVEGDVSDEMGVLRVVSPYVEESKSHVEELRAKIESLNLKLSKGIIDPNEKVIFVEGETDKTILEYLRVTYPFLQDVQIICSFSDGYSSANAAADNAIAWHHLQKSRRHKDRVVGIALLDHDDAGSAARKFFLEKTKSEKQRNACVLQYKPTANKAKSMTVSGFKPWTQLESFAPLACWLQAREEQLLLQKSPEAILGNATSAFKTELMEKGISQLFSSCGDEMVPFLYDVKLEGKKRFSKLFLSSLEQDTTVHGEFAATMKELKEAFGGAIV